MVEYSTYDISTSIFYFNFNLDHWYLVCLCVYKKNQYGTYIKSVTFHNKCMIAK